MSEELKPCPFCEDEVISDVIDVIDEFRIFLLYGNETCCSEASLALIGAIKDKLMRRMISPMPEMDPEVKEALELAKDYLKSKDAN